MLFDVFDAAVAVDVDDGELVGGAGDPDVVIRVGCPPVADLVAVAGRDAVVLAGGGQRGFLSAWLARDHGDACCCVFEGSSQQVSHRGGSAASPHAELLHASPSSLACRRSVAPKEFPFWSGQIATRYVRCRSKQVGR